ncbi:MAG: CHAP domain-containing protein [Myxococcota bacterium]
MVAAHRALLLLFVALTAAACAPRAGRLRAQHPLLATIDGESALVPSGAGVLLSEGPAPLETPAAQRARDRVAAAARSFVGKRGIDVDGHAFRFDCSGVARGIYAQAGHRLGGSPSFRGENDVAVLYRLAKAHGSLRASEPLVGDLVFFDNTYDRDGDGKRNDPLSHVGVVEEVRPDGTVVFIHHASGGVLRYRMNLEHPLSREHPRSGETANHFLRRAEGGESAKTSAELFVAYGTLLTGREEREERLVLR